MREIRKVLDRDSILVVGPRRYGKSSILKKLRTQLTKEDRTVVYTMVEGVNEPVDFLVHILDALAELKEDTASERFQNWLTDRIGLKGVDGEVDLFGMKIRGQVQTAIEENWRDRARDVFQLIQEMEELIIILDELPLALQEMETEDARDILHWLRRLRHEAEDVRLVLCGSVSIDPLLEEVGGPAILADVYRVQVHGFQRNEIDALVDRWFELLDADPVEGFSDAVVSALGTPCCPYFAAALLAAVEQLMIEGEEPASPDLVPEARDRLLSAEGKHYFDHYLSRLRRVYEGALRRAAEQILGTAAREDGISLDHARALYDDAGGATETAFRRLLADLKNDYYLVENDGTLIFAEPLLKDWWRYYGPR